MDPIRNPYAPGAGQRPPELAGRDEQLDAFDVVLERVARGRPERSIVLTGLRGVGKTVLLNALRSAAVRAGWGTGKLEARPEQSLRRPLASAVHQALRELGPAGGAGDHALVKELQDRVAEELDYSLEAAAQGVFAAEFNGDADIVVPEPLKGSSTAWPGLELFSIGLRMHSTGFWPDLNTSEMQVADLACKKAGN